MNYIKRIDEIKIIGKPEQLTAIISDIDNDIVVLNHNTENLKKILFKYNDANSGTKYSEVITAVTNLSKCIYENSIIINNWRNDIAEFQNRVERYERGRSISTTKKSNVQKINIQANTQTTFIPLDVLKSIFKSINQYVETTNKVINKFNMQKRNMGLKWKDKCFMQFDKQTTEFTNTIAKELKKLSEYSSQIERRLKQELEL